jgi:hypothetical protein
MAANTPKRFQYPRHWTLAQRLDHHTDKSGGEDACWPWMAQRMKGYGYLWWKKTPRRVHRLTWIEANGPIPPDKPLILHKCDHRPCCNPAHLWAGTQKENMDDMRAKGRMKYVPARGERSGGAKLTEATVRAIRADRRLLREIATEYGVHPTTVGCIQRRKNWRHVL